MKNSRRKGHDGEREFAAKLRLELAIGVERNLNQTREGGYDLKLDGFAIEVKRAGRVTPTIVSSWWAQALRQANDANLPPVLAYRQDRRPWVVRVPMSLLHPDLPGHLHADLDFPGFCFIVNRGLNNEHVGADEDDPF